MDIKKDHYLNPFTNVYVHRRRYSRSISPFVDCFKSWFLKNAIQYLPDLWNDLRNQSGKCKHCDADLPLKCLKFDTFCSFSCSTSWFAKNTDRVAKARKTIKQKKAIDPTFCLLPNQTEYWIKKGFNSAEAQIKVSERQRTFSRKKCIEKNGSVMGLEQFNSRQQKWQQTLINLPLEKRIDILRKKTKPSSRYKLDEKFSAELEALLGRTLNYGDKQEALIVDDHIFLADCFDTTTRKVIEIFGDYYHFNPKKYSGDFFDKRLKMTAEDKWAEDERRINLINSKYNGVLIIWEDEIRENKAECLMRCLKFLN